MDTPLSPQILLKCPASEPSFLAALAPDATGAVVSPVECAVSAAAADDAAPADDSRAPTSPLAGAAEGTVSLVAGAAVNAAASSAGAGALADPPTDVVGKTVLSVSGAAFDAAVSSAGAGALAAPPTDVVRKTVPPVSGATAGTTVDAAPADDVGASTTALEDAAGKTLVSGTASVAGAERGFLTCSPSPPDVWIPRDGCCRAGRAGGTVWELRWR